MKDIAINVWKPIFVNGRLKKVKCKIKYYIDNEIADDFVKKAESLKGHYIDRDSFKLYVLQELLKDNAEGVEILKKAIYDTNLNILFVKTYFESILDD